MKRVLFSLAVFLVVVTFAVREFPAAAQQRDKEVGCEVRRGGEQWRCLFNPSSGGPTATVLVENVDKTRTVAYQADEYHSLCGGDSDIVDSTPQIIEPLKNQTLNVLCPGRITCREKWIVHCTVNGVAVNCDQVLKVTGYTWKGNRQKEN